MREWGLKPDKMRRKYWSLLVIVYMSILQVGCAAIQKENKPIQPTPKLQDSGFLVPTYPGGSPAIEATQKSEPSLLVPTAASKIELPDDIASRVGFGVAEKADPLYWAKQLKAGWYLDWSVRDAPQDPGVEHWQMIRLTMQSGTWKVSPGEAAIREIAHKYPGNVWILGNEPDVIWQDAIPAEVYAQAYHDLYGLLKEADPRAVVAPAGISQATDMRLAYLDRVLAEYKKRYQTNLPVDLWTIHGFVLREERGKWGVDIPPGFDFDLGMAYEISDHGRIDLFSKQLVAFRKWMAANGYKNKPLALTEFGILMSPGLGYSSEFTVQYLNETFTWLAIAADPEIGYAADKNRLVQRWAWFSLSDSLYPAPNLADLNRVELTALGRAFQNFMINASVRP